MSGRGQMMRSIPRYGHGGTLGDAYATRITETFTELVKEAPTPEGRNMIPGLFSWANTIPMGKSVGATPNAVARAIRSRTARTRIPAIARTARPRQWLWRSLTRSPAGATPP